MDLGLYCIQEPGRNKCKTSLKESQYKPQKKKKEKRNKETKKKERKEKIPLIKFQRTGVHNQKSQNISSHYG